MKSANAIKRELEGLEQRRTTWNGEVNAVLGALTRSGATEEEGRAHRDLATESHHAHAFARGARWALWWVLGEIRQGPTDNAINLLTRTLAAAKAVVQSHADLAAVPSEAEQDEIDRREDQRLVNEAEAALERGSLDFMADNSPP